MAGRGDFFVTEGTLSQGAACYVVRQADQDLLDALSRGEFAYVLDSRQKGKSSLMIRAREALEASGTRTVLLDLQRFGSNLDPDRWYASMLQVVGEQLDIEDRLFAIWDAQVHAGPMRKFFAALETGLGELGVPCVVFVDEIDFVRSLPFSTDEFFAGIRECLNRRAGERVAGSGERETDPDPTRPPSPATRSLTFCLLGVATPSELIRDVRITPFNVGKRIELTDFTLAELAPYEAPLGEGGRNGTALLKRIHHWTAGHPYLTQKLASAVAADPTAKTPGGVDRLVEQLFFSLKARSEEPNLADVSRRVLESPIEGIAPDEARSRVLDLYRQVRDSRVQDDETDPVVAVLKLSGLTRVLDGYLVVRNRVYFRAFDKSWVQANLPEAEAIRVRRAERRAALRVGLVGSTIALSIATLAVFAIAKAQEAETRAASESIAKTQAVKAESETVAALKQAKVDRDRANQKARDAEDARKIADNERKKASDSARAEKKAKRGVLAALSDMTEQKMLAELATRQADLANTKAERNLYYANVSLASRAWLDNDPARVRHILQNVGATFKAEPEYRLMMRRTEGPDLVLKPTEPAWDSVKTKGCEFVEGKHGSILFLTDGSDLEQRSIATGSLIARLPRPIDFDARKVTTESLAIAPTGVAAVVSDSGGEINLYDLNSKLITARTVLPKQVDAVGWDPLDRFIIAGDSSGTLHLLSTKELKVIKEIPSGSGQIMRIAVFPDGSRFLTSGFDGKATLWNSDGHILHRFSTEVPLGYDDDLRCHAIAVSSDGKKVAVGRLGGLIQLFDSNSYKPLFPAPIRVPQSIHDLAFSPDGKTLAIACFGKVVVMMDTVTGDTSELVRGHEHSLWTVRFSKDGKKMATTSWDGTARIWDTSRLHEYSFLAGEPHPTLLRYLENGSLFAAGSNGVATVAPAINGKSRVQRIAPTPNLKGAAPIFQPLGDCTSDGRHAAMALDDGRVQLTDLKSGQSKILGNTTGAFARAVAISPDKKWIAIGGMDTDVRMISLDGQTTRILKGHRSDVQCVSFSPDGKLLASGSGKHQPGSDNSIIIWDVAKGQLRRKLTGHTALIWRVSFDPSGKRLVSASWDTSAIVWNVNNGSVMTKLIGSKDQVMDAAWSPDGKRIATVGRGNSIALWEPNSGRETMRLDDYWDVISVCFSLDGRKLAIGAYGGKVIVYDFSNGGNSTARNLGKQ